MSRVAPAAYASIHAHRATDAELGCLDEHSLHQFRALRNTPTSSRPSRQLCADAVRSVQPGQDVDLGKQTLLSCRHANCDAKNERAGLCRTEPATARHDLDIGPKIPALQRAGPRDCSSSHRRLGFCTVIVEPPLIGDTVKSPPRSRDTLRNRPEKLGFRSLAWVREGRGIRHYGARVPGSNFGISGLHRVE